MFLRPFGIGGKSQSSPPPRLHSSELGLFKRIRSQSALTPMLAAGSGSTEVDPPTSGSRSSAAFTATDAGNAGRPDGKSPAMAWTRAVAPERNTPGISLPREATSPIWNVSTPPALNWINRAHDKPLASKAPTITSQRKINRWPTLKVGATSGTPATGLAPSLIPPDTAAPSPKLLFQRVTLQAPSRWANR